MEEKKLIPKRRFEGFEGDWYKNKLKNLASFSKGRGYSKNDIKNRGTELLLYGSLYTSYQTIVDKVNVYTKKKPNSVLSNGEEVVVPSSGETKEDIARASAIVKSGIIIGGDLNIIQPTEELNSVFLALEISNGSSQQELIRRAQGSSVVHLYNDDLKSVVIYYPDLKEQQKIGKFFRVLDERIANQERKIAKVKALKEAYLAEMFPQEGETVPKRRFKGFKGEWEFIALGSIASITTGSLDANAMVMNGKYDFYTSGIKKYKINTFAFEGPAITVAGNGATVGYMHLADGKFNAYQRTYVIGDIHGYREFLFYEIQNKLPKKIREESRSGNIPYIVMDMLTELHLKVPSLDEQQKIGAFFKHLDDQIEAEEAKLEKLKQMKEAYLEEMFV